MDLSTVLAGAEYVRQIVGLKGDITETEFVNFNEVHEMTPHVEAIVSREDLDLVPGTYIENNVKIFNDDYAYIKGAFGNIIHCFVGIQIPTLIEEFESRSMSSYEQKRTDPSTGKYYNYNLIYEDPEQYINNQWIHPFYQIWHIKIHNGYHGIYV